MTHCPKQKYLCRSLKQAVGYARLSEMCPQTIPRLEILSAVWEPLPITNIITHQCSTVVRATIRVNGKHQILGTRSPQTPQSIELKFDTAD